MSEEPTYESKSAQILRATTEGLPSVWTPESGWTDPTDVDETSEEPDIWAMLEESAPQGCEAVQDLYSWSLNYNAGTGPMTLFIDLIGWTADNMGEGTALFNLERANLGYLELSKLASALEEYASDPRGVSEYVEALMAAEAR